MNEIADRNSWKTIPMDQPKRIKLSLHLSVDQYTKLIRGFIPCDMGEKWFYFYEKGWVYFHRSWTGFLLYKAEVKEESDEYTIHEFWVERNKFKYENDDDREDVRYFESLIDWGIRNPDEHDC